METGEGNPMWYRDLSRVQNLLDIIEPLGTSGIKREALVDDVMDLFPKGSQGGFRLKRHTNFSKLTETWAKDAEFLNDD